MKRYLAVLLMLTATIHGCKKPDRAAVKIVPRPVNFFVNIGKVKINRDTKIITETSKPDVLAVCSYLQKKIQKSSGFELEIVDVNDITSLSDDFLITTRGADSSLGKEGYRLNTRSGSLQLQSPGAAGLFYGIQSLLQLLPPGIVSKDVDPDQELSIPAIYIYDYPRFQWRGMHLDVGRHFFPKEFIKKYIDLLSMYKMNTFHWHLTEDQGWRIEIKKYPLLTRIGAWRKEADGSTYGGFYTQEDIREIVDYAAERHVTIVPEIEMPGHCMAALAAYPELSCTGGPFEVPSAWGVKKDVFCAGNEKTYQFIEDVLLEVIALFPGEYIHIGGDEVPAERWENCPKCQKMIRDEKLMNENELQSYFIRRIGQFLNEHGKKLIGWDEIIKGGLAPGATVMSWRGMEGGINAAQKGHDVVMTPASHCYFDYYQDDPSSEPKAIGGYTPLEKVYGFEPVPPVLNDEQSIHIIGVQGNVWTEYISTTAHAEYMAIPRMIAMAEVAWLNPDKKSWKNFLRRMENQFPRLDILNVNYFKGNYQDTTIVRDSIPERDNAE